MDWTDKGFAVFLIAIVLAAWSGGVFLAGYGYGRTAGQLEILIHGKPVVSETTEK